MGLITSNGARLYIGESHAVQIPSVLANESWTRVRKVESFGEFGSSAQPQDFEVPVDDDGKSWIVQKRKGTRDYGSLAVTVGYLPEDGGQVAMFLAEQADGNEDFAFKIALGDNEEFAFYGIVLEAKTTFGAANNIVRAAFTIAINSPIY